MSTTDSYRPRYNADGGPPTMPAAASNAMYHFQGNQGNSNPAPPRGPRGPRGPRSYQNDSRFRPGNRNGRFAPGAMSSRPLLRMRPDDQPDDNSFLDPNRVSKFREVDEITDSGEDEMSESDDDSRPAKRLRTEITDKDISIAIVTNKWSNPDPYTALPPPTESTGKRTDVVKLIRKAKITDDSKNETDLAKNEDFIAFDGSLDLDDFVDVPTGPSNDDPDHLGKRKRDQQDAKSRQPRGYPHSQDDAPVLREYQAQGYVDATPWLSHDPGSDTAAAIALHKEVIDFYEWIHPKEYEQVVRQDVLKRLSRAFNQIEMGGVLKAFGSYAAGLYLPTGDMDLVWLQQGFRPGQMGMNGLPTPPPRSLLNKFARRLREKGLAQANSVQLIPWAKVPIIKFVDDVSGIKVDLSFNNDTGVTANTTVQKWKSQYPAMTIIVSIIKQFLKVRGLNDVASGGLGGFSIICLVTSLIQHMPDSNSPSNLGQLLVEFFNLYGNLLDRDTVAIRLDPPGYIDKATYQPHLFNREKAGRLTIIDPNRPENNISGGTREIDIIAASFSSAYDILQARLAAFADGQTNTNSFSFLESLVGGNFDSYENQRTVSRNLYFGLTGNDVQQQRRRPPPPPPPSRVVQPPPPPLEKAHRDSKAAPLPPKPATNGIAPITSNSSHKRASTTSILKNERRAARLKEARPDLTQKVGESISKSKAVRVGGYKDPHAMEVDLKQKMDANKNFKAKNTK